DIMVEDERQPVGVEDLLHAHLLELLDGQRCGDIVGKQEVHLAVDEIARTNLRPTGMSGKDLLGHRHAHWIISDPVIARSGLTKQSHLRWRWLRPHAYRVGAPGFCSPRPGNR